VTPAIIARLDRIEAIFGSQAAAAERFGMSRTKLYSRVIKPHYKPFLSLVLHAPWATIESGDYSNTPLPNASAIDAIIANHEKVYQDCVGSRRRANFDAFKAAYPDSPIASWVETNRLSKLHRAVDGMHRPGRPELSIEKADSSRFPESPCGHCQTIAWEAAAKTMEGRIVAYFAVCSNCKRRCGAPNRYWPLNPAFATKQNPTLARVAHQYGRCSYYGCRNRADDKHHYAPRSVFGTEADSYGTVDLCKFHHARWHRTMNDWKRTSMIDGLVYAIRTWTMDGGSSIVSIHTTMREAQDAVAALVSQHTAQTVEIQEVPILAVSRATAMKETSR